MNARVAWHEGMKVCSAMPFGTYKSISDVATAFEITCIEAEFIRPLAAPINDNFRAELAFVLREVDFSNSELSVCENLIYPLLKEVWKAFTGSLMLWGHQPLIYDEDLSGVPDYMVAKRSPLGKVVRSNPYVFLVVEAKKDNFDWGWGQCLAAMLAAQKINNNSDQTVFGAVSNGRIWEFAQLQGSVFTHDTRLFPLQDLDALYAAVHFIFAQCRQQVSAPACAVH